MSYTIGVPKEIQAGECLVALVPEVVTRLLKKGATVQVESGAGEAAYYSDDEYASAGAVIVDRAAAFASDIVVKVRPPTDEEVGLMKSGAAYVGFLSPLDDPKRSAKLAAQGVTALSMELIPRISRAQKMDALSALSSIAGYRAALVGAELLPRFYPLLSTAAGTVRPANVLVLGAGVAGLQAIATARRLGAKVSAYDVREAVKEEVHSLGAAFVDLPLEIGDMQDSAGYAKALADEKAKRQTELLVPFIAKSDVVISTALIPGRKAPVLISAEAVRGMRAGSVIVDMAAPNGGNCELTEPGSTVVKHGVRIVGAMNLTADMPVHASELYSKTVLAVLLDFTTEAGFTAKFEDEVFAGSCVTHGGAVVHQRVKGLLA